MPKIETLQQFYSTILGTVKPRRAIVQDRLKGRESNPILINPLKEALLALETIPVHDGMPCVRIAEDIMLPLDLGYEINELKKDLFFVQHDEKAFYGYLNAKYPLFHDEVLSLRNCLCGITFQTFLTDRDGTVNNYCGRYASSVQSVYNAVFLSRFAQTRVRHAVILTSAPLENIGLVDIIVSPAHSFILAGSKGREYYDTHGRRGHFPVEKEKQLKLDELNNALTDLTRQPSHRIFTLIGSGLQFKFGQTTIARQDITQSIPENASLAFKEEISSLVRTIDPRQEYFRVEDTGKDVEIILTIENENTADQRKDFDKGDGIKFLDKDLCLKMKEGICLICGDTASDIPMILAAQKHAQKTFSVFVTTDETLKANVRETCPQALFVSRPDALVAALNALAV